MAKWDKRRPPTYNKLQEERERRMRNRRLRARRLSRELAKRRLSAWRM